MKRLVLFILLSFLLVGCSEEKKTDTVKKENKYVNIDLMKKLSAIDEINLEKDIKTLLINSFKSSFLSEERKKEYINKI